MAISYQQSSAQGCTDRGMKDQGNPVFCLMSHGSDIANVLSSTLDGRGLELAELFGLRDLPNEYRIGVLLLDRVEFRKEWERLFNSRPKNESMAFATHGVFLLDYRFVSDRCSSAEYCEVMLHECVHVLQHLQTRIPPAQAVWLYESVACYLSGQSNAKRPVSPPTWSMCKENFIEIPGCYHIAYRLGEALFSHRETNEVIYLLSDLALCEQLCQRTYERLFPPGY